MMINLNATFDPVQVEARNAARFGWPTATPPPTWAQQAAALIAGVEDHTLRVALRDNFEERAAMCEYEGNLPRDEAEMIAFKEIRDTLATWRK